MTEGARRERREKRERFVFPLGHPGLPPSFLAARAMLARGAARSLLIAMLSLKVPLSCVLSHTHYES